MIDDTVTVGMDSEQRHRDENVVVEIDLEEDNVENEEDDHDNEMEKVDDVDDKDDNDTIGNHIT